MRVTSKMIQRGARALNAYGGWDQGPRCMHGCEPANKCSICAALRVMDKHNARTVLIAALAEEKTDNG